ncbi:hypothetical protein [Nannocystis pusilla]
MLPVVALVAVRVARLLHAAESPIAARVGAIEGPDDGPGGLGDAA